MVVGRKAAYGIVHFHGEESCITAPPLTNLLIWDLGLLHYI